MQLISITLNGLAIVRVPEQYLTFVKANQITQILEDEPAPDGRDLEFMCDDYLYVSTRNFKSVTAGDWYVQFCGITWILPDAFFQKHFRPLTVSVDNATPKTST